MLGVFDCGFCQLYRSQAEVFGSEGKLIIENPLSVGSEGRILLGRGSDEEEIKVPEADPYRCQVDALTAAVLDGAPLPVTLDRSRANVATMVALYKSARRGVPQPVPAA